MTPIPPDRFRHRHAGQADVAGRPVGTFGDIAIGGEQRRGGVGMPVGSIGPTRGRCLAKLRDLLAGDPHWEGQL